MKNLKHIVSIFFLYFSFVYAADEVDHSSNEKEFSSEDLTTLRNSDFEFSPTTSKDLEVNTNVVIPNRKKSTFIAVGLSSLVPGLGHTYLGDLKTAGSLFGSSGTAYALSNLNSEGFKFTSFVTTQNISLYGIYAAYRDTHIYNNDIKNIPINSFSDLSFAPFNLKILKKPEVWGGFLGALSLAVIISEIAYNNVSHVHCNLSYDGIKPLAALPIGIGEESFFRGFIQSSFYSALPPWGAITMSSLIFGLAHIPNALVLESEDRWRYYSFSLPFITSLGAYFGFLTYKNKSLKESVALHAWYDFTLFLAGTLLTQSAIKGKKEFSFSFVF